MLTEGQADLYNTLFNRDLAVSKKFTGGVQQLTTELTCPSGQVVAPVSS